MSLGVYGRSSEMIILNSIKKNESIINQDAPSSINTKTKRAKMKKKMTASELMIKNFA